MTAPSLDYAAILASTTAIAGEFAATLAPANPIEAFLAEADEALKAECELLAAWERSRTGATFMEKPAFRREIVSFVLNRHRVVEWPAWASEWVKGGD